ncbi:hypothetical protein PRECH8_15120 [Insulibacter thermoxylanivorax]|uniref:PDZ domain-containing protein n=1 Tax=Insulibacter thermoxylanivorax TaxID=2749268 RepID=A0A916QCH2_9BACL|nr:trypsin-like peptidase domain-containing protein [Insulibacter thermoxylanivorax]GFR38216.1 hypothetical protein PRECH8_15120 [Insulibacter thermoxylanivorax]
MGLFQDDFYSTKPSRAAVNRRRRMRIEPLRLPVLLFIIGLALILAQLTLGSAAEDQPVSGEVHLELPSDVDSSAAYDQNGDEDPEPSTGERAVHASQEEDKDVHGHPNHGDSSSADDSVEGIDEISYRSDIARATAQVYDAVVSIVMKSEEETVDWDKIYAIGSGIVFRIEGDTAYIVTNHHVAAAAEDLEIVLADGRKKAAELIGSDAISDLAVLSTDAEGITKTAVFGTSSNLQIGEPAIAIGNPLGLGHAHTITSGIISSTQRSIPVSLSGSGVLDWEMEVLQTDAAINSGNSGGALININGEVIGINTMKIAWFGVEGLGFAIPIDLAAPIIEELVEKGRVSRPYIGIGAVNLRDYTGEDPLDLPEQVKAGAVILSVDGPAKKAGLRKHDVIVRLDDTAVNDMIDVRKYLYNHKGIGEPIKVTLYRNGRERTYEFELGEMPE